jgi:hypothetical protein
MVSIDRSAINSSQHETDDNDVDIVVPFFRAPDEDDFYSLDDDFRKKRNIRQRFLYTFTTDSTYFCLFAMNLRTKGSLEAWEIVDKVVQKKL